MSTETSANESLLKRLQALAEKKNAEERQRVEALIEDQWKRMPDMKSFDFENSRLCNGLRNLLAGLTGQSRYYRAAPQDFGRQICDLMEYTNGFTYQQWSVKKVLDSNVSDEDNLELRRYFKSAAEGNHVDKALELFMDVMLTMGKLARRINSTILGRVVALIVKCKCLNSNRVYNHEQADALTQEINECWWTLQTEIELIDEEDKVDIFPVAPTHADSSDDEDDYFDEDQFSNDEDPDYATSEARDHAVRQYRQRHKGLIPSEAFSKQPHPMEEFALTLKKLADEMEAGTPSIDGRWSKFDYNFLSRILATDFSLSYEDYERVEDGDDEVCCIRLEHNTCWEDTKEESLKKKIVADLKRYLTAAAQLSQKINSRTYKNWTEMLALLENHGAYFYCWFSPENLAAKKDLKKFIELFKPARQQMWSDVKVYLPEANKTVIEISDESTKKAAAAVGEQFADAKSDLAEIKTRISGPNKSRADIVALVRDILTSKIKGVTSIPKAVGYIRAGVTSSDEVFYDRCMWAREFAKNNAKKQADGVNKFWRSIVTNVKQETRGLRSHMRSGKTSRKSKIFATPIGW